MDDERWSAKLCVRPASRGTTAAAIPGADGRGHRAADPAKLEHGGELRKRGRGSIWRRHRGLSRRARPDADERHCGPDFKHESRPVHEPVYEGCHQRDDADHATAKRAVAKPARQRGELRQRFRRLAARDSAGRRPGAGGDEHRPDAGGSELRQLHAGASRRDRRHQSRARSQSGQPDGAAGEDQLGHRGLAGADEHRRCDEQGERRQLQHAAIRRRGPKHASAESDQRADGEVQPGVQLPAATTRHAALGPRHDAARHFDVGPDDPADDDADRLGVDHPEGREALRRTSTACRRTRR